MPIFGTTISLIPLMIFSSLFFVFFSSSCVSLEKQFVEAVLPSVMFMLDKTRLDYTARSNPVKVVRAVAAMVRNATHTTRLTGQTKKTDTDTSDWKVTRNWC